MGETGMYVCGGWMGEDILRNIARICNIHNMWNLNMVYIIYITQY